MVSTTAEGGGRGGGGYCFTSELHNVGETTIKRTVSTASPRAKPPGASSVLFGWEREESDAGVVLNVGKWDAMEFDSSWRLQSATCFMLNPPWNWTDEKTELSCLKARCECLGREAASRANPRRKGARRAEENCW